MKLPNEEEEMSAKDRLVSALDTAENKFEKEDVKFRGMDISGKALEDYGVNAVTIGYYRFANGRRRHVIWLPEYNRVFAVQP